MSDDRVNKLPGEGDADPFNLDNELVDDDDDDSEADTENPSGNKEPNPLEEVKAITQKETRRMTIWKVVVVLSILLTGAGVSVAVYSFLDQQQDDDFENRFALHAATISESASLRFSLTRDSLVELATEYTAYAHQSNSSFPFVTMPLFEVNARHARMESGVEAVGVLPYVSQEQQKAWEKYSVQNQWWIEESRGLDLGDEVEKPGYIKAPIFPFMYELDANGVPMPTTGRERYTPIWQFSPAPIQPFMTNFDPSSRVDFSSQMLTAISQFRDVVFSKIDDQVDLLANTGLLKEHLAYHGQFVEVDENTDAYKHPHSTVAVPIWKELNNAKESDMVGVLLAVLPFDIYLGDLLPEDVRGIDVILENTCNQTFSYTVNGNRGKYLGPGDFHDSTYDRMEVFIPLRQANDDSDDFVDVEAHCVYNFRVYPSAALEGEAKDNLPFIFGAMSACVFLFIAAGFFSYDVFVSRRNKKIVDAAAKSNAIVLSLFPAHIRDKLLKQHDWSRVDARRGNDQQRARHLFMEKSESQSLHADSLSSSPIAELFPSASVLFGDLAGFTAWSSSREPSQVFVLLESLYSEFDRIAKKRKVFKVETIGDCYVAACGLPNQRPDHAVVLARFARDCLYKMNEVVQHLEVELGPDTSDLSLRIGIHSGPVTAGVLRGDRARFQLFGDTVNTAARMESTGIKSKIHISQETADLLISHGKDDWITKREEKVVAKGKGEMQTYWLNIADSSDRMSGSATDVSETMDTCSEDDVGRVNTLMTQKTTSLIKWNVEMLSRILKAIIAGRPVEKGMVQIPEKVNFNENCPLDEVVEVFSIPTKDNCDRHCIRETCSLPPLVKEQLVAFVGDIAALYRDNPFHNFDHASHVTMSVVKLLSRIVSPSERTMDMSQSASQSFSADDMDDISYGITSDPLVQFACVFCALVHDVDHHGVSNAQLVSEGDSLAKAYKNRSVLESNSIDLAWKLFMQDDYADLRTAVCADAAELKRFRQLVVNTVLATDIMDQDLKALRNRRWEQAFHPEDGPVTGESAILARNRKATIVIEHLIQASDVAHTMQHWHVYRKWNERLFMELARAYMNGRATKHPVDFWYEGELGFFDFYIIPLAKKLKECGVFGVSSDEYLTYALKNRQEFETRGKQLVAEMAERSSTQQPLNSELTVLMEKRMSQKRLEI